MQSKGITLGLVEFLQYTATTIPEIYRLLIIQIPLPILAIRTTVVV